MHHFAVVTIWSYQDFSCLKTIYTSYFPVFLYLMMVTVNL